MNESGSYEATTDGVRISVSSDFLDDQSEPEVGRFVWAYHVTIENRSPRSVQLLTRHWKITDATGNGHQVVGDGVVGEQPILRPGEVFEYSSGTPLATASGIMTGSYRFIDENGRHFDVAVPAFSLDSPHEAPRVH